MHISAAAIHFIREGDGHRLPRHGDIEIGAQRDDPRNGGCPARGQNAHRIAGPQLPVGYQSREAAKIEVRTIDPLHRHAKRPQLRGRDVDFDGLEMREQGRAACTRACCPRPP